MRSVIDLLIALIVGVLLGLFFRCSRTIETHRTVNDTVTHIDTVTYRKPMPVDSLVLRYRTVIAKVADTTHFADTAYITFVDSVAVELPITQKAYKGDDYCAWVSGYAPQLDSIKVYSKTETVTMRQKTKHWNVGVQTGIGVGARSFKVEPYIGIGIQYNLF